MYIKLDKTNIAAFLIIKVIMIVIIVFVSYDAGKDDGKKQMLQSIAKCTIKDAYEEKCFIPCSDNYDCLLKNGMSDH